MAFFAIGCSSSGDLEGNAFFEVVEQELDIWENRMPGPRMPTVHFSGSITLKNVSGELLRNVDLHYISLRQDGKFVAGMKPEILKTDTLQTLLPDGGVVHMQFKNERQLPAGLLDVELPVEAELTVSTSHGRQVIPFEPVEMMKVF